MVQKKDQVSAKPISFADSLEAIIALEREFEKGAPTPEDGVVALLKDGPADLAPEQVNFQDAIDRRIFVSMHMENLIKTSKSKLDVWKSKHAALTKVHKEFKAFTATQMRFANTQKEKVSPGSDPIKFEGTQGTLALQRNNPAMKLQFDTYSMSDLVSEDDIVKFELPASLYTTEKVYKVNKEAMKEFILDNGDLNKVAQKSLAANGEAILASTDWGHVSTGTHFRIRS
jgi:hypothetical protein